MPTGGAVDEALGRVAPGPGERGGEGAGLQVGVVALQHGEAGAGGLRHGLRLHAGLEQVRDAGVA